jgi:hypothetical protein
MRSPGVRLSLSALSLAAVGLALAACGDEDPEPTEPSPTGTATPGPTATGAGVADCVVGDWRSTGVEGEVGGDPATVSVSGGGGVALTLGPDGATTVDFAGMDPVSFDGQVAGADVAGELVYDGQASGTVQTDTGATSGSWEPVDSTDWSDVRVTLDLTEPVAGRPIDDVSVSDVVEQTDEVTGKVVDVEPMLGEGTFECQDDTLVLSPAEGDTGMTWTLTRG